MVRLELRFSSEFVVSGGKVIVGRKVGRGRICSGLGDIVEARTREKLAGRRCTGCTCSCWRYRPG